MRNDLEVKKYINKKILKHPAFDEWYNYVEEILLNKEFQKRQLFYHHYHTTVWEHSINVSFTCFLIAKKLKLNKKVCAISGLLHDFYPYAWLYNEELAKIDNGIYVSEIGKKNKFFKQHGFTHAEAATKNYLKYFYYLQDVKITNSIKRHMFPLNIIPPKYIEGYVLTLVDKYISLKDIFKHFANK